MTRIWPVLLILLTACPSLINYMGKGYVEYNQGNFEKAEQYYRKAIAQRPKDAVAYNNLGVVFQQLDREDDAIKYYKLAAMLDKKYVSPHINLSALYYEKNKPADALQSARKAYEIDANNPLAMMALANALVVNNEELDRALTLAKAAVERPETKSEPSAWSILAEALYKLGQSDTDIRAAIDKAMELDPEQSFYRRQSTLYLPIKPVATPEPEQKQEEPRK